MLNRILFVTVLSLMLFTQQSNAQSAVYFCAETGQYGFCYGAASEMAARQCAYTNCIKMGGTKPVVEDYSSKKGFCAICIGTDYIDQKVIGCAFGYATQDEADEAARKKCEDKGGYKMKIKEQWEEK